MQTPLNVGVLAQHPKYLAGYDQKDPFYMTLRLKYEDYLYNLLATKQPLICHASLALGADMLWAKCVAEFKSHYPEQITMIAEISSLDQPHIWKQYSYQNEWKNLLSQADHVKVYAKHYQPNCITLQKNGLVNSCDYLLVVNRNQRFESIYSQVQAAKAQNVEIHFVAEHQLITTAF